MQSATSATLRELRVRQQVLWSWACPACGRTNVESLTFGLAGNGMYQCERCFAVVQIDVRVRVDATLVECVRDEGAYLESRCGRVWF